MKNEAMSNKRILRKTSLFSLLAARFFQHPSRSYLPVRSKQMKALYLFVFLLGAALGPVAAGTTPSPFEDKSLLIFFTNPSGKLDSFVFGKLKQLGIQSANPCSDAVFLRRVYLDVIGTLPTPEEARKFLDDKNNNKRAALIDRLLERDEFADYWGMKWCDLLRVKAEFPVNLWPNAAQAYDRWIRTSIRQNKPYSHFVWEILTSNGSNFKAPPVNFYRSTGGKDPKSIARAVALTFMGERAEKWPQAKWDGMAAFFSQVGFKSTAEWKEEIVYYNGNDKSQEPAGKAVFPDGTPAQLTGEKDPREAFATWLLTSKNSPFARNAVNRVWFWLMGRGIIQEPDDSRSDNPPSNPELLSWLAQELISSKYDIKHIYRLILNSKAYQLSCIPGSTKPEAEVNFAYYPLRRLEAEVLIDALDQITGSTEEYSSMIPEPFTWVPEDKRSIALPDGSISSAFLDLFGRPPRDTGVLSERNNRPTSAQRLHLLNSSHIQSKITASERLKAIFRSSPTPLEGITQIYLLVLSRYPTLEELAALKAYTQTGEAKGWNVSYDLTWALMNSAEFLYRH